MRADEPIRARAANEETPGKIQNSLDFAAQARPLRGLRAGPCGANVSPHVGKQAASDGRSFIQKKTIRKTNTAHPATA